MHLAQPHPVACADGSATRATAGMNDAGALGGRRQTVGGSRCIGGAPAHRAQPQLAP